MDHDLPPSSDTLIEPRRPAAPPFRVPITLRFDDYIVSFSRCRQEWHALIPSGLPRIRHCASCAKDVHLVADMSGFEHALADGRCIAVSVEDELHCGGEGVGYDPGRGGSLEW